jgi:type IX secretion system PorP/SprF family membrane protein
MNKKLLIFIVASLIGSSALLKGQDPHFSQFYANPLYLNPALAGAQKCPQLSLNYRNQYPVLGVYQTYSASYDQYVDELNGGLGGYVMRDEAGDGILSTTEVALIYSYHLKMTRKFTLLAGFQTSFRQVNLDYNRLTFPDQIDPFFGFVRESSEVPPGNNTVSVFDVSAGLVGFTEKFYIGFAAHHLTQPDVSFFTEDRLPMKFTGHMGLTIPLGRQRLHKELQNFLIPNIVYQVQGPYDQLTISTAFTRSSISGGLGFRTSTVNPDAIVVLLGFNPSDQPLSIGYSYDITISTVANNLGGSHEISLGYKFPCRSKRKRSEAINCPRF